MIRRLKIPSKLFVLHYGIILIFTLLILLKHQAGPDDFSFLEGLRALVMLEVLYLIFLLLSNVGGFFLFRNNHHDLFSGLIFGFFIISSFVMLVRETIHVGLEEPLILGYCLWLLPRAYLHGLPSNADKNINLIVLLIINGIFALSLNAIYQSSDLYGVFYLVIYAIGIYAIYFKDYSIVKEVEVMNQRSQRKEALQMASSGKGSKQRRKRSKKAPEKILAVVAPKNTKRQNVLIIVSDLSGIMLNLILIGFLGYWWCYPEKTDIENIEFFTVLMSMEFFMVHSGVLMAIFSPFTAMLFILPLYGFMVILMFGDSLYGSEILWAYLFVVANRILTSFNQRYDVENRVMAGSSSAFAALWFLASMAIVAMLPESFIPDLGLSPEKLVQMSYEEGVAGVFSKSPKLAFMFGMIYFVGFVLWDLLLIFSASTTRSKKVS